MSRVFGPHCYDSHAHAKQWRDAYRVDRNNCLLTRCAIPYHKHVECMVIAADAMSFFEHMALTTKRK